MLTFKLQKDSDFALGSDGRQYNKVCTIYSDWIAQGNMPLPADPAPNPAIAAIDVQLADIDFRSIRPIREGDTVFLATLTAQAIELRTARALLPKMV